MKSIIRVVIVFLALGSLGILLRHVCSDEVWRLIEHIGLIICLGLGAVIVGYYIFDEEYN